MQNTANDQMDKMTNSLIQACSDANNMMRDSMNMVMQSATIMTKGCTDMCDAINSMMQKSLENSAKTSQAMMSAKSIHDVVDMHSSMMKSSFDNLMTDMTNLSQLSAKVVQDATTPVTNHVNDTINKMSKTKAA